MAMESLTIEKYGLVELEGLGDVEREGRLEELAGILESWLPAYVYAYEYFD